MAENEVTLETRGKIAIITLNREKKLNALDADLYFRLATLLQEVAAMPNIYITILTGKGRFFSAYEAKNILWSTWKRLTAMQRRRRWRFSTYRRRRR